MKEKFLLSIGSKHSLFPLSSKAKKAPTENPEMRLIPYFTAGLFILFSEVVIPTKKRGALNESAVICCSWDPASRFHPCTTVSTCKGFLSKASLRVSLHLCCLSEFQRKTEGSFLKTVMLFIIEHRAFKEIMPLPGLSMNGKKKQSLNYPPPPKRFPVKQGFLLLCPADTGWLSSCPKRPER